MSGLELQDRIVGGLWGAVVGDALGVPVEFKSRDELHSEPVREMRGGGTWHQPPGTWSDDSSLLLCTAEYDLEALFERFAQAGSREAPV